MNATSDSIVLIKSLWVPYNVSTTNNLANTYKKKNVKFTLEQAMKLQRGSRVELYTFFNLCARGVGGRIYVRAAVCTGAKGAARSVGTAVKNLTPHRNSIPGPSSS